MSKESISIPKGTRDFGPEHMYRRNYIFNTLKQTFEHFGFQPIETPSMENLSTLLGKYGEEGDKLLFKILNSGDYLKDIPMERRSTINSSELTPSISEKGLRYDLTVPFARFVVMHRNEITFPFRRYQMQPVWRADRPQKGRYREFYQCDVDVVGSNSLLEEADLIQIIEHAFKQLKVNVIIKINNRKILQGVAESAGVAPELFIDFTVALDKLDKTGTDTVLTEMKERGITDSSIEKIRPVLEFKGSAWETIEFLGTFMQNSETGMAGLAEMRELFAYLKPFSIKSDIEFDITLARGLNYYTGCIFEVKSKDVSIGSICGGGRYDNLTGVFGMPGVSGVGISFGADRIYDVMNELKTFPAEAIKSSQVLIARFGAETLEYDLKILALLRNAGISARLYPEEAKMKKQFAYADALDIPFVIISGTDEMATGVVTLKNMKNGEQEKLSPEILVDKLKIAGC